MPQIKPAEEWTPGKNVTFVGRVSEEKGIDEFLEAAKRLPEISFAVAGSCDAMPNITTQAAENVKC